MPNWLSFISAPITQWIKNRGEEKAAKHTRKLAVINNQARLATDTQSNNHEWEMANLQDKDNALRWCSFWLFALPIVITVISPEWGAKIFTNLKIVPEWFVQTLIAMIGGIWGMTELKKAAPQFISAIQGLRK
jgi:hypothetical protein